MLYTWMRSISFYILHVNLEGLIKDKDANKFVQPSHEGVIAHNVTLGAYNIYKFLEFIHTKGHP